MARIIVFCAVFVIHIENENSENRRVCRISSLKRNQEHTGFQVRQKSVQILRLAYVASNLPKITGIFRKKGVDREAAIWYSTQAPLREVMREP
jgi:hypothetical protein